MYFQNSADGARALEREANLALRELLEKKHLYQAVHINVLAAVRAARPPVPVGSAPEPDPSKDQLNALALAVSFDATQPDPRPAAMLSGKPELAVRFHVPTVMAVCPGCEGLQPFNVVGAVKVSPAPKYGRLEQEEDLLISRSTDTFSFAYECQSCKGPEDVFLVRREGWKLTLCGRSPIELVAIPSCIPSSVRGYYRSAVVARDSGEVLAGLFLLRVLIEQFTRPCGGSDKSLKADVVIDRYISALPEDFKARFPSFRPAYEKLSVALHSAEASDELFEAVRAQIEEHFDARRLYKLPLPTAAPVIA